MRVVCISNMVRRYHSNGDVYEVVDSFLKIGKSNSRMERETIK